MSLTRSVDTQALESNKKEKNQYTSVVEHSMFTKCDMDSFSLASDSDDECFPCKWF